MEENSPGYKPTLYIGMFGRLIVTEAGVPVERLHLRKADRLLAYLALHAGHWVDKKVLVKLFWDVQIVYEGEQNLRQTLHFLRRELNLDTEVLESRSGGLRLNLHAQQCDVLQFEVACSGQSDTDLSNALDRYTQPLLAEWTDEWVITLRALYDQKREHARQKLRISLEQSRPVSALWGEFVNSTDRNGSLHPMPVGGAVPLDSRLYIERAVDHALYHALFSGENLVVLKGSKQTGKSSLIARGMRAAREQGWIVLETDFEQFTPADVSNAETFFLRLIAGLAEQSDVEFVPEKDWKSHLGAAGNLESFLRRRILKPASTPILWALDGVDRLFLSSVYAEFFAVLRGFYNKRASHPESGWDRLHMLIASATEAHLFIRDLGQSPFNVGIRIEVADFTPVECEELHRTFGAPLARDTDWVALRAFLGGHPYLLARGLAEIRSRELDAAAFIRLALQPDGPYHDHLEQMVRSIADDEELREAVQAVLRQTLCSERGFFRLRSAGILSGEHDSLCRFRCDLYARHLERHFG